MFDLRNCRRWIKMLRKDSLPPTDSKYTVLHGIICPEKETDKLLSKLDEASYIPTSTLGEFQLSTSSYSYVCSNTHFHFNLLHSKDDWHKTLSLYVAYLPWNIEGRYMSNNIQLVWKWNSVLFFSLSFESSINVLDTSILWDFIITNTFLPVCLCFSFY